MILIDFIDMIEFDYKCCVLYSLEVVMSKDRVKINIYGFMLLGLIEMICKWIWESIEYILCGECLVCKGWGIVKIIEIICFEIMWEIVWVNCVYDVDKFVVYVFFKVVDVFMGEEFYMLVELEVFVLK